MAGTRPNFMKVSPIISELGRVGASAVLVHTGQHYDQSMSAAFFEDLALHPPHYQLEVGSGTHALQTAKVMERFEPVILAERPRWVVVVGDVNSTLAAALVTAKLRDEVGSRLAHVEAGLRSNDWRMPEEINRVLTDRVSDLLLTPSRDARANLIREGLEADAIVFVGNVMIDSLFSHLDSARQLCVAKSLGVDGPYAVTTLHRPSNVDNRDSLQTVLAGLSRIQETMPVIFPIHPRTRKNIEEFGLNSLVDCITLTEPLGYKAMLSLTDGASIVLTDSGGLQEETSALRIPCVTLREQTERPVTLAQGSNTLVPWPMSALGILETFEKALSTKCDLPPIEGWDGHAARRIVEALLAR
ncbi:MAG: non-hydrolyzing UDP-N-acetylglucosamine 2-epimerase [Gemmatimonadaceae bacterium]